MNKILFSTGSNIGNRPSHLKFALKMLEKRVGKLQKASEVYETQAWGNTDQRNFLNQVLSFETELSAAKCLVVLQAIEHERLRVREKHWGPRTLDIDILFFNQEIIETKNLIIPHPLLSARRFVLLPLSEIYPDMQHPALGKSIKELLTACKDKTKLISYK